MKPGLICMAAHSGRAIVPTAFTATRCWRIPGRWTDLVIPKPFSTVFMLGGHPIYVPKDATHRELTRCLLKVQADMDCLTGLARLLAERKCRTADEIAAIMAPGDESAKAPLNGPASGLRVLPRMALRGTNKGPINAITRIEARIRVTRVSPSGPGGRAVLILARSVAADRCRG